MPMKFLFCDAGGRLERLSDGEVMEGVASVSETAITGESAPVIRDRIRKAAGGEDIYALLLGES